MASNVRFLDQVLINPVGGAGGGGSNIVDGAANYIVKFKDANTLTTSSIYEDPDSGNIGIKTTTPNSGTFQVSGSIYLVGGPMTIVGTTSSPQLTVQLDNNNGDINKFQINNEGVMILGSLDNAPTAVEGGIFFSSSNDYFFGFS